MSLELSNSSKLSLSESFCFVGFLGDFLDFSPWALFCLDSLELFFVGCLIVFYFFMETFSKDYEKLL